MSTLLQHLTSPEWTHVVKALLHTLWQASILAVLLGLVLRRLSNPAARYRCALAALVVVTGAWLVTWAVLNRPDTEHLTATATMVSPPAQYVPTQSSSPAVVVAVTREAAAQPVTHWTAWLALVWIAGAAVMLLRAAIQVAGAERMRRATRPLDDSHVAQLIAEAQRAVRLTRTIRVAVTDTLTSPAVVGVLVPTLILPLSLITTLTPEQLRFVLLHELAHIRRGDYFANLFQLFAEALLFFNPAVWWISHQVRREREACCDALAIELSNAPADYARTLVTVAENMLVSVSTAATAFGNEREPSSLTERVQRMLVPGYRPSLRLTWRAMLAALFVGGILLVLSAVGTRITVAAILSPQERIEKIEKKMTEYGEKPAVEKSDNSETLPKVKVSGRVRMADGSALPKIKRVNVYTARRNSSGASSARMETNGVFSVSTAPGRICAGLDIPGFAPIVAGPVNVEGTNRIENLDLILEQGFETPIIITDTDTGTPITDAMVKAQFWVRGMGIGIGKSRELKTDAVGKTALTQCSDTVALTLVVNAPGYEIIEQRIEKLNPQAPIHLKLQRGMPASGVVLNKADNTPLAGATVRLIYEKGREEKGYQWTDEARVVATTDATGRFTVNQLQRNTKYWLGVSAPGHESVIIGPLLAGTKDLSIPLGAELIVRGRVIGNLEGLQIINDDYCLSRSYSEVFDNHSNGFQEWVPIRVVDGQATFQFTNPIPGRVTLSGGQGYREERDVTAPMDDWVVNLTDARKKQAQILPKREVVFRFKHPSGVPPRGTVSVSVPDNLEPNYLTAHTEEKEIVDGEVRIEIAIGGRTYVEPKRMVGYWFKSDFSRVLVTNGIGPMVVEISVIPAGAIFAQARNTDGTPAGGLFFSLRELKRAPSRDDSSSLGSGVGDGFSGNAPRKWVSGPLPLGGTYQVIGHRGNSFCASQPITLTEEKPDAEVMLQFLVGKTLEGLVLDADGQPVRDAELNPSLTLSNNHSFGLKAVFTDEQGQFRIEDATPGIGDFSVTPSARGLMAERVKLDFNTQPQTIRLKHGRKLSGRVVQAGTGYPIPGAEVRAMNVDQLKLPSQTTRTDADGRFEFTTLGDTTYMLFVSDAKMDQQPRLRAGEDAPVTLTVTLYEWSKLKPKAPIAKRTHDSAAEKAIPTNVASNALIGGLPKSLYENSPGARIGFSQPVELLFTLEVREDGTYWVSNKRKTLPELRDWLSQTIRPGAGASVRFEVHTNAPPDSKQALRNLCKELGMASDAQPTSIPPSEKIHTRTYKVDPVSFLASLRKQSGPAVTNAEGDSELFRRFFADRGVNMASPQSYYYSYGTGALLVRATLADLDRIDRAVQQLSSEPQQELAALRNERDPVSARAMEDSNSAELLVRTYKVDPDTFIKGLETLGSVPVNRTNASTSVRDFFKRLEVDLSPPKSVLWNDRNGLLMVRATKQDLDTIEREIQRLNYTPPKIKIEAKFIELTDFNPATEQPGSALRLLPPTSQANTPLNEEQLNFIAQLKTKAKLSPQRLNLTAPPTVQHVFTEDQADAFVTALRRRNDAEILSMPSVSTGSGRKAQVQVVEIQTIVTGLDITSTENTNGKPQIGFNYTTEPMNFGPVLNFTPTIEKDGHTIGLTVLGHISGFVGYDDPGTFNPGIVGERGATPATATLPIPRLRLSELSAQVSLLDGQSVLLGGPVVRESKRVKEKVPLLGSIPLLGRLFQSTHVSTVQKHLIVLVKAELVDPAGNRLYGDRAIPTARTNVPPNADVK